MPCAAPCSGQSPCSSRATRGWQTIIERRRPLTAPEASAAQRNGQLYTGASHLFPYALASHYHVY
eukprot:5076011-Prymnesium_polylepis.1